MNIGA